MRELVEEAQKICYDVHNLANSRQKQLAHSYLHGLESAAHAAHGACQGVVHRFGCLVRHAVDIGKRVEKLVPVAVRILQQNGNTRHCLFAKDGLQGCHLRGIAHAFHAGGHFPQNSDRLFQVAGSILRCYTKLFQRFGGLSRRSGQPVQHSPKNRAALAGLDAAICQNSGHCRGFLKA